MTEKHYHPVYDRLHCGATDGIMVTNEKDVSCPACRENERRARRLVVTFPRLRFVDTNGVIRQIEHVASELSEIREAYLQPGYDQLAEETVDLMQSCATLLYILMEHHGIDFDAVVKQVQIKNRVRGYEEPSK